MEITKQMKQLKLHGMQQSWEILTQTRKHLDLSVQEALELMLQSEAEDRENRRFQRLQRNARFRYQASIEELHLQSSRGLDRSLINILAKGDYIRSGQSILVTGATGCGKSFMVSALGHQACMQGYKVHYFNIQKLFMQTKMSRADGTILKLLNQLSKTDLLILDDFGLTHLEHQQRMDLLEIIEDRHNRKSMIIASQLPVPNWFETIGEQTIADAIIDRLIHTAHKIELKGESMRRKKL